MRFVKVFMSGHSQAIRLPKEFQFHAKEVAIARKGNKLILWEVPKNLSEAFYLLTSMPDDFFEEARHDSLPQEREGL